MEAALAEALEWLEEQDGTTGRTMEEDYEEKLREVEEVCGSIIK
jgi:heat shock protein 5